MQKRKFIGAAYEYCDINRWVPAPYIRKSFCLNFKLSGARLFIATPGFYELYVNGCKITKGELAPYISNPDHICYEDIYNISGLLKEGENVVGIILGNGFANQCITSWGYSKASFRAPLCVAVSLEILGEQQALFIESDESFKTYMSPVLFDMYRYGMYYDACKEMEGWCSPGFDDSLWNTVHLVEAPKGKVCLCEADPVRVQYELTPVYIKKQQDFYYLHSSSKEGAEHLQETYVKEGWLYDFGKSCTGVCRLKIRGKRGQKVTLRHCETLRDGNFNLNSIYTIREDYAGYIHLFQADTYILKGGDEEIFTPFFTYHGFRYVLVEGITKEQATEDLLTFLVFNSDIRKRAFFCSSDRTLNTLYDMGIHADLSNFVYFPTDCPHREKNGWTGDIAVSAEQLLLNFDCSESLRVWMESVRCAQLESGMLPGIVPTAGWGYHWGNGPRWDSVITEVPYYVLKYDGRTDLIVENADMMMKYLNYISGRRDERGLVKCGLGDWCQPGSDNIRISSPLEFTDSCMVFEMASKVSFMMRQIDREEDAKIADKLAREIKQAIREHLLDKETMTAAGACQTSQALGLYLGIFEAGECTVAYKRLLEFIEAKKRHVDCGMIGLRCIFHVLFEHGDGSLAYEMITREDEPSYGSMIKRGGTALFEALEDNGVQESQNHHFLGDILNLFISKLAGIVVNPDMTDEKHILIAPHMIDKVEEVFASFKASKGEVCVSYKNEQEKAELVVEMPEGMYGEVLWKGERKKLQKGRNVF